MKYPRRLAMQDTCEDSVVLKTKQACFCIYVNPTNLTTFKKKKQKEKKPLKEKKNNK